MQGRTAVRPAGVGGRQEAPSQVGGQIAWGHHDFNIGSFFLLYYYILLLPPLLNSKGVINSRKCKILLTSMELSAISG